MSGHSVAAGSLVAADYLVFALLLVVSAAIGIFYAWVSRGQQNSRDFLTGGRRLTALPVSISLTASFMSSTTLLANPVEKISGLKVYTFGAIFVLFCLSYILSIVITSEVFLPVFYRLSITSTYELMAYLVMDIFTAFPGLPGLFFAAVYSGSLSTVSSSINALATVTIEDLVKPYTNMSEKHLTWLSKGMSVFYGVLCMAMAGLASLMGGIMQTTVTITGVLGGPLLGLFILGIFCPFANSKGGLSGLMIGLLVAMGVCIGALIFPSPPYMTRPLPLTTEGCNFTTQGNSNWTSTILPAGPSTVTSAPGHITDDILSADNWLPPSYLYFSLMGTVTAFTVGLFISLVTGGRKQRVESRLMIMKEDKTLYHMFRFFRGRVTRKTGNLDLTKNREEKTGNTNPAFNHTEMDSKKRTIIS